MNRFFTAILLVFTLLPLLAQGQEIMPDTTLLLPLASGLETRWVFPPAGPEFISAHRQMRLSFVVDKDGHAWLGFADGSLLCPQKNYRFKLPETFWDFVCLDNGVMLFATTSRLALLDVMPGEGDKAASISLQPVALLPPDCKRMCKGTDNCLYFISDDEKGGKNTVWLLKPKAYRGLRGIPEYQKVFVSDVPINAVAGDGVTTWVASGRMIVRIGADKQLRRYYLHPHQVIVDLEYSQRAGLFYSTAFAAGYVGENGAIELFNTRAPEITLAGDSLYLLFARDYGVLAVDGISQLPAYDQPLAGIKKISAVRYDQ